MSNRRLVSDHAIVRYLERFSGHDMAAIAGAMRRAGYDARFDDEVVAFVEQMTDIDLAAVRRRMLSPPVLQAIGCGASGVVADGVRYVISGGTIVTVMPPNCGKRSGGADEAAPPRHDRFRRSDVRLRREIAEAAE